MQIRGSPAPTFVARSFCPASVTGCSRKRRQQRTPRSKVFCREFRAAHLRAKSKGDRSMPSTHIAALRALLEREKGVLLPGAPNALAARLIADLDFKAVERNG